MSQIHELQAQRITDTFAAHNIRAQVWEVKVAPRFYRYTLTCAMTARVSKLLDKPEDIALNLGVNSVRIFREGGAIIVEVPRDAPREVGIPIVFGAINRMPANCAVLGVDSSGAPLLIRIDSPDVAHIFVAGTTGSGKSALLRTLLLSFALTNNPGLIQFALIDPDGDTFSPLAALPHLWRGSDIAVSPSDAALMLAALVAEMERRARHNINLPRIIVAIDELADLIQVSQDLIIDPLQRLTERGRKHGLHVVAATQRPAATMVGGMVKANFPVRMVGSVVSPEDAKVAAGIGGTGAERLLGRGDFILVMKGSVLRFQAAYNKDLEYKALVSLIATGQAGRKRRAWTQVALEQGIYAAREATPRALRPVSEAVRDLVQQGGAGRGALVPYVNTYAKPLTVDNPRMSPLPVHHPTPPAHCPNGSAPSPDDAPASSATSPAASRGGATLPAFWQSPAPASSDSAKQSRGALPRRPDGPTLEDAQQIQSAYSTLGSLNKTCKWAYRSKGPLTMFWVKSALAMQPQPAEEPLHPEPAAVAAHPANEAEPTEGEPSA